MAVLVESVEPTKSGKAWRVKAGGLYYNAFKDSGIENYVGQMIEAEITTHEKYGSAIAKFRPVNAAPQVAAAAASPPPLPAVAAPYSRETTYAEPAKPGTVAPWWWPSVSNVWAAQSAAGNIKTPSQLRDWATVIQQIAEGDAPF